MRYAGRLGILLSVLLFGVVAGYSEDTNPFIATNDATGITFNSADLHGTTNPAGSPTAAWFEWGKTTSFGSRTDAETFAAGTTRAVTFVTSIRNLEPHTTYYFRAVLYRAVAGAEARLYPVAITGFQQRYLN